MHGPYMVTLLLQLYYVYTYYTVNLVDHMITAVLVVPGT
jgi:hypothetical protein